MQNGSSFKGGARVASLIKPRFKQFENGLKVVCIPNSIFNTGTIMYRVGSREDPEWFEGAAHAFEHMAIRGVPADQVLRYLGTKFGSNPVPERELYRLMRRYLGGTDGEGMGVYTMHTHTAYGHGDLLKRRYMHEVLGAYARVLRDVMYDIHDPYNREPTLTDGNFAIECAAVDNETTMNQDDGYFSAMRLAQSMLYWKNPIRRWGFGDEEQLRSVSCRGLMDWAKGFYVPERMYVVMIGPGLGEATKFVREHELDQLPAWEPTGETPDIGDIYPQLKNTYVRREQKKGLRMRHIVMLWPIDPAASRDRYALQVLAGSLKERIEDEVRDRNTQMPGGVYHPAVDLDATSTYGFIRVWLATKGNDAHVEELTERTLQIIRHFKQDRSALMEEDVLDRRVFLRDDFVSTFKYFASTLSERVLSAIADDGDEDLSEFMQYGDRIGAVSVRDVRRVAQKYLHEDRFVRAIVGP